MHFMISISCVVLECHYGQTIEHLDLSLLSQKYLHGRICPQNKVSLFDAFKIVIF